MLTSDRELRFGYQLNGSLVLATNQNELKILDELMDRGRQNGVQRLRILQKEELFKVRFYVHHFAFYDLHLLYISFLNANTENSYTFIDGASNKSQLYRSTIRSRCR